MTSATGVAFRSPLLPYASLAGLTGGAARAAWTSGGDLAAWVRADLDHLDGRLRALVADPLIRAALALASPDLDAALDRWLASPSAAPPRGLLAYAGRLAARCVPYGLSAGCASGTLSGTPAYDLAGLGELRTRGRLDIGVVARLADALAADPAARDALTFRPNPTAYVAADRLRYVERVRDGAGSRYHQATVEEDDALRAVLIAAAEGARLRDLARALTVFDATEAEAYDYVTDLVEAQLLVPDVPAVTGEVTPLLTLGEAAGLAVPAPAHVDASRPAAFVLGDVVVAEALRAVEVLHPLYRETSEDDDLAAFVAAFTARYGAAEVPLLEALDEEVGVGFGGPAALAVAGAPLLGGLRPVPSTDGPPWTPIDHHLVDILARAVRDGAREVELGPFDLGPLRNTAPRPLPDAFAVVGTVAAPSAEAVVAGDFRVVVHEVAGPNGAGALSRFSDLDDGVDALVRAQVAREEALRPDAVFAEVVHLPDGRAGNAAVRPVLRGYEIPLLGSSALPGDRQLPPSDLTVSVVEGRVRLRSRRLGREVVPRLTAAHDHVVSTLPAYRFLGALQRDGVAGTLRWSWGQVQSAPYLPRVVVGRLVLAKAQWRWFKAELAGLTSAPDDTAAYAALQRLRDEWGVPRFAAMARGEHEVAVDLAGVAAATLLAHEARRAGQLILREQYPAPGGLVLTGPEGAFTHEFVLPCTVPVAARTPAVVPRARPRAYVPGTEWLAVRLHTGVASADGVLRDVVRPLVAGCDRWSYDRVPHLRVCLHGDPVALLAALREHVAPLVDSGRIADVGLETYRSPGDVAERLAHADSEAALRLVETGDDLDARWRAALHGLDRLLADAGLDDAGRLAAAERMRDRLVAAYGETGERAVRLAGRMHRAQKTPTDPWPAGVLEERSRVTAPLLAAASADELDALCAAHVTRLLRAAHDAQHLVLADLLGRRYRGLLATRRPDAGTCTP